MIMKLTIETKRIFDKKEAKDGTRVLVVRSWPRGVRLDEINLWVKDLGPSRPLVTAFKAKKLRWPSYEKKYLEELETDSARKALISLVQGITSKKLTLLCACKEKQKCHTTPLKKHISKWLAAL